MQSVRSGDCYHHHHHSHFILHDFCQLRHIQRVRRKRRLERELFHQYSYSDVDDLEQQMTGDFESVIDTQFVAFNDRAGKNLHEDTSVVRFLILRNSMWNNWIGKLKCSRKQIGIVLGEN